MKSTHSLMACARSWFVVYTGAWILTLIAIWSALSPYPAWAQSAWPNYPNNQGISVTGAGNIGIGTASPKGRLHVNGFGRTISSVWNYASVAEFGGGAARNNAILFNTGAAVGPTSIRGFGIASASQDFHIARFDSAGTQAPALDLTILSNGNVGIGTTNPQSKLAVNGTVTTKEVIVTNIGWSDYVFRAGYRLSPLSEIKAYIEDHQHLPDIPSEAEVKAKGVSVGDMQATLLAKIEELTLYIIGLEEHDTRLQEQYEELMRRLEAGWEQGK